MRGLDWEGNPRVLSDENPHPFPVTMDLLAEAINLGGRQYMLCPQRVFLPWVVHTVLYCTYVCMCGRVVL